MEIPSGAIGQPVSLLEKVQRAQRVITKAVRRFPTSSIAVAWTGGKDSTVLLHLIRTFYHGRVPFPVFFNDSTMEFKEVYRFINRLEKVWGLKVFRVKHLDSDLATFSSLSPTNQVEFSRIMKINAISWALDTYHWKAFMVAIRHDEHPARSKETYFSKRSTHFRIHPILHFTESDIWSYIKVNKVPYVSLYKKGYRSLGERPFTRKAGKHGSERSGREPGKEFLMQRLRELGYW